MIKVRLQIADGAIEDTFSKWGFIYMKADNRTEAPIKAWDTASYIEDPGEYIDPRSVQDSFDYTAEFLIECPNKDLENANTKIADFNQAIYDLDNNTHARKYKEITFYNDYKRVKIVGYPEPISEPSEFYRRADGSTTDFAIIKLKIRVCSPEKCDFCTTGGEAAEPPLRLSLLPVQNDIKVSLSRDLKNNEHVVLLRRGSAKMRNPGHQHDDRIMPKTVKRKHKWQVYYKYSLNSAESTYWPFYLNSDNLLRHSAYRENTAQKLWCYQEGVIKKAQGSRKYMNINRNEVTFGVSVYATEEDNEHFHRVSDVKYFKSILNDDGSTLVIA